MTGERSFPRPESIRAFRRGRGAADEQIGDDGKHHRRPAGGVFRRHPGQVYRRFPSDFLLPVDRKAVVNGPGIFPAGLDRNGGVQCNAIETGEYLREKEQVLLRRDVPGEEKTGVRRRVEGSVEFPELFVSQVGNPLGIAPESQA